MRSATTVEPVNRSEWNRAAHGFLDYSYRQTWDYGVALAERRRATSYHVAIRRGSDLIGMADVRMKQVPIGLGGIAYICGGPIVRCGQPDDNRRLLHCLDALRRTFVEGRGLVLRILAPVGSPEWNTVTTEVFRSAGFLPTDRPYHYRTFLVPLDRSLDSIRAGFSHYWRRNLNRALRKDMTVRIGSSPEFFEPVREFHRKLIRRKRFDVELTADFYANLQQELPKEERFLVSVAEMDGKPASALVLSLLGDTCVGIVGATSDVGARSYASYRLFWDTIVHSREQGMRWFDVGGIDPVNNRGVFNFKRGLNGIDVSSPGPFEVAPSGLSRKLIRVAETLYLFSQRLRKRRTSRTQRTPITSIASRSDS